VRSSKEKEKVDDRLGEKVLRLRTRRLSIDEVVRSMRTDRRAVVTEDC
jgi:hypothetical protein